MEFSSEVLQVSFEKRQGENELCGAQLREIPFFEKCWITACYISERKQKAFFVFFSILLFNQSTGPTEQANRFSLKIWQ